MHGRQVAARMSEIWRPPNGAHGGHMVTCVTMHVEDMHCCPMYVCVWRMCMTYMCACEDKCVVGVPCRCVGVGGACACVHVRANVPSL